MFYDNDYRPRTLGIRDKQILYRNANGRCQNPACKKKIDFDEMQVGHKTAWSRGGSTTLKNSVCLCYRCNKLQGTDSWATFMKKQGMTVEEDPKKRIKRFLGQLSVKELKSVADKRGLRVRGTLVDDYFDSYRKAPTKSQYISKLISVLKPNDMKAIENEVNASRGLSVKKSK